MPSKRLLIDANLLVLFVVGRTSRQLIAKHRRLREFSVEDYDRLIGMLDTVDQVVVTPNTLTETSNLLAQHREPERSRLLDVLRYVIESSQEITVASVDASHSRAFRRLGLTDAAVLHVISAETPVLTVDLDLFIAASTKDPNAAVNFRHLG